MFDVVLCGCIWSWYEKHNDNPWLSLSYIKQLNSSYSLTIRWQWCWWHRYVGDFMMVTDLRCWWQNHYVGDFFRYVGDFLNVLNRSPTSQTCNQLIWSPTSVTNIDVTDIDEFPDSWFSASCWKSWCLGWILGNLRFPEKCKTYGRSAPRCIRESPLQLKICKCILMSNYSTYVILTSQTYVANRSE